MTDCVRRLTVLSAILASSSLAWADGQIASFLPSSGLAKFIASEWDIRSIRSSLNARRAVSQSRFLELGLSISATTDKTITMDGPQDTFVIEVLKRGDANKDGIEDVVVCLSESAKEGTLATSSAFLLQRYSNSTPLIALAYTVTDKNCD